MKWLNINDYGKKTIEEIASVRNLAVTMKYLPPDGYTMHMLVSDNGYCFEAEGESLQKMVESFFFEDSYHGTYNCDMKERLAWGRFYFFLHDLARLFDINLNKAKHLSYYGIADTLAHLEQFPVTYTPLVK